MGCARALPAPAVCGLLPGAVSEPVPWFLDKRGLDKRGLALAVTSFLLLVFLPPPPPPPLRLLPVPRAIVSPTRAATGREHKDMNSVLRNGKMDGAFRDNSKIASLYIDIHSLNLGFSHRLDGNHDTWRRMDR